MSCRISSAVISRRRCSERVMLSLVLFVPSWSGCRLLTPFESATDVDTTPCSPQASESTFACPTSATALYDRQVTLSNQADRPSSPHCSTSCPSDWYNITSVMPYLRPASRARANDDMKPRRAASEQEQHASLDLPVCLVHRIQERTHDAARERGRGLQHLHGNVQEH